jgi:galactokinase
MDNTNIMDAIKNGKIDHDLISLYGEDNLEKERTNYSAVFREFEKKFQELPQQIYSVPGRTEMGGNHTDHNNGRVLAGAVHLDAITAAAPVEGLKATLLSRGFEKPFVVDLNDLDPVKKEEYTTTAIIRGIAAGLKKKGHKIGGFRAYVDSRVLPGSGLSSSANIELVIASIFNHLYNDGNIPNFDLAQASMFAEVSYYGKPSGFMDQIACSWGGILAIDFEDPGKPVIERVSINFEEAGYVMIILDTGGDHSDLTPDYAGVPREMGAVAAELGEKDCRGLTTDGVLSAIPQLREKTGDRAILRALHFLGDNERVKHQIEALKRGAIKEYLAHVNASGDSSQMLLQNSYSIRNPASQGISLSIAVLKELLGGEGACRVHGGGFAGTVQAYIPLDRYEVIKTELEKIFGQGSVTRIAIRKEGARRIL